MRQINFNSVQTMSTPAKVAAFAFSIVLLLPLLILLIVAGVVASIVFGVLFIIGTIRAKFRSFTGRDKEGRHNVRVRR